MIIIHNLIILFLYFNLKNHVSIFDYESKKNHRSNCLLITLTASLSLVTFFELAWYFVGKKENKFAMQFKLNY